MCQIHGVRRLGWRTHLPLSAIIALLLAMILSVRASEVSSIGWRSDLRTASRQAAQQHKNLLVVVGARWCGACQQMHHQTLNDPSVIRRVSANFIPVLIDADEQPEVLQRLNATALPTVIVMAPDTRILQRSVGFQSATELGRQLEAAAAPVPPKRHFIPTPNPLWGKPMHTASVTTARPPRDID